MTHRVLLALIVACLWPGAPVSAQTAATVTTCDASTNKLPRLSLLAIQTGRLAPGESTCFGLTLARGEFARVSIDADAYVRARLLGPARNVLQVTWISSFSFTAPSLPLAIEAPESGRYVVELTVPTWVSFKNAQDVRVQMSHWESATLRAARRQDLLQDPRVTWLRANAQRVRSIDPADSDFSDLDFLREALRGARVVLIGEGDNGGGSDLLAKTRLVKFLHEQMEFDVVVFQAGIHSSTAAWRALQTEMAPREAALKSLFGVLGRSAQAEALFQYLSARARTNRPLELAGFDSQLTGTAAGTFLPELQRFLNERGSNSALIDSQAPLTRVLAGVLDGRFAKDRTMMPTVEEQAGVVARLRFEAQDLARRAADREGAFWAQALRSTATQVDLALNNLRGAGQAEYLSGLGRQMADNMKWLVNTRYAGRKVVVWSHTLHVMRNAEATGPGRAIGYTMGQGLSEALGTESFAIGLTSFNGASHWVTQPEDYTQDLIPAQHPSIDFETLMEAAGHQFGFVNLRTARARGDWLGGRFVASPLYLVPEDAEWSKALDGLLFIRTQEPRRRTQ
jgi:erythromycin esterase